ncbi:hypothetical protein V5799_026200 [Amblyomma americanum]|uniref:Uncharacterized protein n=1 Tax=Amblyomma americanum TaxID=6943 RepID=A0AAQ4DJ94_AMBAM
MLANFRRCQRVCNRVLSNTSLLGVVVGVGENLQNATQTVGTGIRGGIQGVATGVRQGTAAVVENVRKNIQVNVELMTTKNTRNSERSRLLTGIRRRTQAVRNGIRPSRYPEDDYKDSSPALPESEDQLYVVPAP